MTVAEKVRFCDVCFNIAEEATCRICRDPPRPDRRSASWRSPRTSPPSSAPASSAGSITCSAARSAPIDHVGPADLHIAELLRRLPDETVTEVILATDPNLEGEATATFLARMLGSGRVTVSRLASGLPVGGDLEYADEVTLGRAFTGRRYVG